MRPTPLLLALAFACQVPAALTPAEPAAPSAVYEPEAATPGDDDGFFLGDDDLSDVVGWDTTATNVGLGARAQLAAIPICTTCIITVPITTVPITTVPTLPVYADADSDGYDSAVDCNDNNSSIYPGAAEVAGDGVDQDCDGGDQCYADADGDGYGAAFLNSPNLSCADSGEAAVGGDCNDNTATSNSGFAINPDAEEICDGVDNDCDGDADLDDDEITALLGFLDEDDDGFGAGDAEPFCGELESGYAATGGDCDDDNATVNPAGTEVPDNGVDEDCLGGDATTDDTDDPVDTDEPDDTDGGDDDGVGGTDSDDTGSADDDATDGAGGSCTCASSPSSGASPGVLGAVLALGAAVGRRRRR